MPATARLVVRTTPHDKAALYDRARRAAPIFLRGKARGSGLQPPCFVTVVTCYRFLEIAS
jgi:hypothetical protein